MDDVFSCQSRCQTYYFEYVVYRDALVWVAVARYKGAIYPFITVKAYSELGVHKKIRRMVRKRIQRAVNTNRNLRMYLLE